MSRPEKAHQGLTVLAQHKIKSKDLVNEAFTDIHIQYLHGTLKNTVKLYHYKCPKKYKIGER